ncbi:substrate-binding periplasmic protein [Chryseolinea lacunae]|uniref:Transporter substrate-binding domain-containing protein n=1 Tax=Chryseolinea lacunae TaxID=2801331 RepID=A0ABS1KTY7_9BACT|nr:transporter substrate-binding domain-containing protein [Chryseolinea lacunae]MBL0741786.1 transporter substrate-binding domain-containing protein [Chryseolinea lacunae]
MRVFLCAALLVALSSVVSIGQKYHGDSWADVKANGKGTLTIVYYEQPGLVFKDNGQMKGVCVDIIADFAKFVQEKYNKTVTVNYAGQESEFSGFLKIAQNTPNILGVTNTSITDERKKIMKFTPPFMTTQLVLLTNQNAPTLTNLKDLPKVFAGFSALVITGSTHVKYAEKIKKQYSPELNITLAPSSESVIKSLSTNNKIFSILDFTEYVGVVRKKLPIKRHDVDLGNAEELGFIMSKSSDWDGLWKEFLTEDYRKGVRYKRIIADNLGSTFLNLVR